MTLEPGAHVCALASTTGLRAALTANWIRDGLEAGERVVWAEPGRDDLPRVLTRHGVPWQEALERGQFQMAEPEGVVGLGSAADIPARLEAAVALQERSIADGYPGLRLGIHVDDALGVMPDVDTQLEMERAWEALTSERGFSLLCVYDPGAYGERLAEAVATHPRGLTDGLAAATAGPAGPVLTGEIDLSNGETFAGYLAGVIAGGDVDLDLGDLTFVDVAGVRHLVVLSRGLAPRRLRILSPPGTMRRIVDLAGWESEFEICERTCA